MNRSIPRFIAAILLACVATAASAQQYKMNGSKLVTAANVTVASIGSNGREILDSHNVVIAKVDSDGKSVSDSHNSLVLRIQGDVIHDSHNRTVGKMSDVMSAIVGARPEAPYVALWWFVVKGSS